MPRVSSRPWGTPRSRRTNPARYYSGTCAGEEIPAACVWLRALPERSKGSLPSGACAVWVFGSECIDPGGDIEVLPLPAVPQDWGIIPGHGGLDCQSRWAIAGFSQDQSLAGCGENRVTGSYPRQSAAACG